MPEIGLFGSEGGVPITGIPTPIIGHADLCRAYLTLGEQY
jgi:hypothetical protein